MYVSGSAFEDDNRRLYAQIYINEAEITDECIQSFTLTESAGDGNCISMGTTNSAKFELNLIGVPIAVWYNLYKGAKFKVILTAERDVISTDSDGNEVTTTEKSPVPLGYFVVDEVEWTDFHGDDELKNGKITAYDYFYLTDIEYSYDTTQGTTISSIISTIATAIGSTIGTGWTDTEIESAPADITVRSMIGYLAGLQGCIAYFDRNGHLSAKWYTRCGKTITQDEQYFDGYTEESTNTNVQILYLESGTSDSVIVVPSDGESVGNTISFENPMMTEDILTEIYNDKIINVDQTTSNVTYKITYKPLTVKWRGNPLIEMCEVLGASDRSGVRQTLYLMERELNYDGGLYETYKSYGENEQTISFNPSPTLKKVNRRLSAMEQAIIDATTTINNVEAMQSGTFTIIKSADGTRNIGWKIASNVIDDEELKTTNHYILANSEGIGFSSNGGESFNAAAIYFDENGNGHINGNYITANSITTEQINFDSAFDKKISDEISTGGIVIGESSITGLTEDIATLTLAASGATATANTASSNASSALSAANSAVSRVARYCTCDTASDTIIKTCYLADNLNYNVENGSTITVKFAHTGYNTDLGSSHLSIKLCYANGTEISTKEIAYNGNTVDANSVSAWSEDSMVSFVYNNGYWVMQDNVANTLLSDWCMTNNRTYINGAYIATGTIEASKIYTGILAARSSTGELSGSAYFDLDNSLLYTGSNASANMRITKGGIDAYWQTYKVGTFAPILTGDPDDNDKNKRYMYLGYNPTNSEYLSFGYEGTSGGFIEIAKVTRGSLSDSDAGGYLIVRGNHFGGLMYRRIFTNSEGASNGDIRNAKLGVFYRYTKYGVGIACELNDGTNIARLDVSQSSLVNDSSAVALRTLRGTTVSSELTLTSSSAYWNGKIILTEANYSTYVKTQGATESYVQQYVAANALNSSSALNGSNVTSGTIANARLPDSIISKALVSAATVNGDVFKGFTTDSEFWLFSKSWTKIVQNTGNASGITIYPDCTIDSYSYTHYGLEVVYDTTSPTGLKIRPVDSDYGNYLGSSTERWTTVFGINSFNSLSDVKTKTEIADVSDAYESMFDKLRPVSYRRIKGDRTHIGFVAQEVETAMTECGLTSEDFGGLCIDYVNSEGKEVGITPTSETDESIYSLRYEEFIALCVDKIQKLEKRVAVLENKYGNTSEET